MPLTSQQFYEFEGVRLCADDAELVRLADGARFSIRPKERDFLIALLAHPQQTVSYEVLHRMVWPEVVDSQSVIRTMRETKRTLDGLLRDIVRSEAHIIKTVVNEGYYLGAVVSRSGANSGASTNRTAVGLGTSLLPDKTLAMSAALYALMFAAALPLEVAYRWEEFGQVTLFLAAPVFVWIFLTSILGVKIDERLTMKDKSGGLAYALAIFLVSAILLFGVVSFFLPTFPITQASIQTYPAQSAYLKDAASFLMVAFFFWLMPTHFVLALRRSIERKDSSTGLAGEQLIAAVAGRVLYPRFWVLCFLFVFVAAISIAGMAHLLDHLNPSPYMNLFVELLYLRGILYFALAMYCLASYYLAINKTKGEPVVA